MLITKLDHPDGPGVTGAFHAGLEVAGGDPDGSDVDRDPSPEGVGDVPVLHEGLVLRVHWG